MSASYLSPWASRPVLSDGLERHPLLPFLPEGMQVLFLGSFPPPRKRWCMDFFYPNFINDHWRIEGLLFFGDALHFVDSQAHAFHLDAIVPFLQSKGIGFYDTATSVRRLAGNASDKCLEVVEPTDIVALTASFPCLRALVVTGEKATRTACDTLSIDMPPKMGQSVPVPSLSTGGRQVRLYRLPSSSRAYPMRLADKAAYYGRMFSEVGLDPLPLP